MTNSIVFRAAVPGEASFLSSLALRSKSHWGYSEDFIRSCAEELTYSPSQLENDDFNFVVAELDRRIVGFYATKRLLAAEFELEALFVEPKHIGSGLGRQLIEHALESIRNINGDVLRIQGDPNAEAFYLSAGGRRIGSRESESIPGRYLPLFEIPVRRPEGSNA